MTDDAGAYTMQPPLPAGEYHVFVLVADYSREGRTIELVGDTVQDFAPVPAGAVEVALRDGSGRGVRGRKVILLRDGKEVLQLGPAGVRGVLSGRMGPFLAGADASGQVRIDGLRPGAYELAVEGSDKRTPVVVKELETVKVTINL